MVIVIAMKVLTERMNWCKSMVVSLSRSLQKMFRWRSLWDCVLALLGTLSVTLLIYWFGFYPFIPNISLIYLVIVLALASTRGLFAAVLASIAAFLCIDFFLVKPLYTFTIERLDEWLGLFVFLCAGIITGQLASALRKRAQQAHRREHEMRILYELVRDTTNEEDLDHQLGVVVRAVVDAFSERSVRDCLIFLPDEEGKLTLRISARRSLEEINLSSDELSTAAWVMRKGQIAEFYEHPQTPRGSEGHASRVVIRSTASLQTLRSYLSFFPLKTGQRAVGVLCLLIEDNPKLVTIRSRLGDEAKRSDPSSTFFLAFLDQATSMIEHARLRGESLRLEVLQRTDDLRAALISSVSHDLRTPLTSIKAAASSLLQDDVQWDEESRRSFTLSIEHEADRLNRLVENLLDMSRIEAGALRPEKEWYAIEDLFHDVLARMQGALLGREVIVDLPESLPPLQLDYMMIDQVLTNLLENALRYTPAGSSLLLSVSLTAMELTVSLIDKGPGIPSGDLERIFDKFYRVLDRRRSTTGGSGLGLAVCRGLIEAHGGRIWAENRSGGGAIFSFTLPLSSDRISSSLS